MSAIMCLEYVLMYNAQLLQGYFGAAQSAGRGEDFTDNFLQEAAFTITQKVEALTPLLACNMPL